MMVYLLNFYSHVFAFCRSHIHSLFHKIRLEILNIMKGTFKLQDLTTLKLWMFAATPSSMTLVFHLRFETFCGKHNHFRGAMTHNLITQITKQAAKEFTRGASWLI